MTERRPFTKDLSRKEILEIKACTECRECLSVCPVQEVTDNPAISPPERLKMYREFINRTEGLKALVTGGEVDRKLLEDFTRAVFECTTCGACGEICPVGIDTQRLWPLLRREMVKRGIGPIGNQRDLPEVIRRTGNPYDQPPSERYSPWIPEGIPVKNKAEIAYYAGCTGAYQAQPMVKGDLLVLRAIGEPFTMLGPEDEVCCGFPLFITGQFQMLESLVKRLIDAYRSRGVGILLCSCPCCVNLMVRDWPRFYGSPLPFRIVHITQYVADAIRKGKLKIVDGLDENIIYHDPCYLSRGVGVIEEPREVLRAIPGAKILEFDRHGRNSRCCGAGGAARKIFHENAIAMGRLTIDEACEKGADKLVLSCPACYEKVNEAMKDHTGKVPIVDIMELLSRLI